MFMCVKLNVLFDREMKVYYVTQVLNQGVNIKTMYGGCAIWSNF